MYGRTYAKTAIEDMMVKKEKPKKKTPKKTQSQLFKKELSPVMLKKLKEHSKLHKGGMASKHIRKMIIYIKEGNSFNKAHDLTVEFEKKQKKKK
tara:strand:- start:12230 stop:12511 length:282 start_codon:yes stop_codon:yes gene_type:complete